MRTLFGSGVLASFLVLSTSASAAKMAVEEPPTLSDQGQIIVGAERVFGVTLSSVRQDVAGTPLSITDSYTNVGLLWGYPTTVHNVPRFGLDYTVIDNLTIGFSGGFFSSSSKRKSEGGVGSTEREDGPTFTEWLISPRVGYIVDVSEKLSIWLRGGVTLFGSSSKSEGTGAQPTTRRTPRAASRSPSSRRSSSRRSRTSGSTAGSPWTSLRAASTSSSGRRTTSRRAARTLTSSRATAPSSA